MFEGIASGLKDALSFIDRGRLTESNIRDGMRQVRQALLEADVNYEVVTDFITNVTEQSIGDKVLKSLKPSEHIIGIVHQELINLMGPVEHSLGLKRDGITVIMMCGLQGSGKTTTCGKLARMLKNDFGRKPMLVAADLQRPAAIEQLRVIGGQVDVPVYTEDPADSSPVQVCKNGLKAAKEQGCDLLILDTAGRLHVDDELMGELRTIDNKLHPDQAILVCDAMTGQDAVNSAKVFNDSLELDGVILTKLDGDTRGGAALSVKAVTGVPIKYIGVGEQLDRLEEFHPDRMASRILGGGDLATLMEKAQREFDSADMEEQQRKMAEGKFTLDDFRKQMGQIKKLGSMKDIMKMIPGMGSLMDDNPDVDTESEMKRIEGIIDSMTLDERTNPDKIDRNRRHRIAKGCGCDPSDVNRMLKDFQQMSGVMSKMAGMGMRDRMKAMRELTSGDLMDPNSNIRKDKQRSKRGPLDSLKARDKKKQARKKAQKAKKRNRKK
ncbi:Signal recognition particle protein Ffh [hydrothermal vent metagenome]|uniref:signal-recognition-particle GTPase n=1 Tax=hydrothermal vent metagenome TaxID=652676 RepID=A0A3B1DTK3_9ZZZZ